MKYILTLSLVSACFVLASCQKPLHAPGGEGAAPALKPTRSCVEAEASVRKSLKNNAKALFEIGITYLADGSCSVYLSFHQAKTGLAYLEKLKEDFGQYTWIQTADALVSLTISEPRVTFPPVFDQKGEEMSSLETVQECETGLVRLQSAFPQAQVAMQVHQFSEQMAQVCYLDVSFPSDTDFKSFFAWKNPFAQGGLITQMHFKRASGVTSTVVIRPLRKF